MTDLTRQHEEYDDNINNWCLVRDLVKGESALKQHDLSKINEVGTAQQSSSLKKEKCS